MNPATPKAAAFLSALFLIGRVCAGDAVPPVRLFALPQPSLKPHALPVVSAIKTNIESVGAPAQFSAQTSDSSKADSEPPLELYTQRYESMNGVPFFLAPPLKSEPGGFAGFVQTKILDPIGANESVKLRHVSFSGGVVGAVKNRNPLYLLNPLIFSIDW
jgi:hypothetical protein